MTAPQTSLKTQTNSVLVDAHVHFHDCFDLETFLDAACQNFRRGALEVGLSPATPGFLMLTDVAGGDFFLRVRASVGRALTGAWRFTPTGEEESVVARRRDGATLTLIAGRQVATEERLEVLALGSTGELPDGMLFEEAIEAVRRTGATPVIPWGFGKWTLKREALVEEVIERAAPGTLFVGDNSGRPGLGPRPRLFELAEARGIAVLPGSDPLPFPAQATRAGSYGFVLHGPLEPDRPAHSIQRLLAGIEPRPGTFGRLESMVNFCRNQAAMQLRKLRTR